MRSSWVCVDASFLVRLVVFPDDTAIQALWQRWTTAEQHIIAPALIYYEVNNALYQHRRQGLLTDESVAIALNTALTLPIQIHLDAELQRKAMDAAKRYGLAATYDAQYVALAEHYGADLWTTDRKLVNRCQQAWVKLVA